MTNPIAQTRAYYAAKVQEFGATPAGVDWNGEASQLHRFATLGRLYAAEESFSLNDLGCGYGALFSFLQQEGRSVDFHGYDIVPEMIAQATRAFPGATFAVSETCATVADYTVASGIFNVRNDVDLEAWQAHMWRVLDHMSEVSSKGFAFNCLTSFSSPARKRPHLFYADPGLVLNTCLERYSRSVTLLHGAGLYEFTVLCDLRGIETIAREKPTSMQGST